MSDKLPAVHMVVKNEDRFIWYCLSSILPFVDSISIIDTGSTDKTADIISSFSSKKIHFSSIPIHDPAELSKVRQYQLEQTAADWIWIVDGDEVYPKLLGDEISDIIQRRGTDLEGILIGRYDLMGDIYHYQDESVGTYNNFGRKGHFALRLLNKKIIKGLHIQGIYPYEGYYDGNNNEVLNREKQKYYFTNGRLYHAMYLQRSTLGTNLFDTFHRMKGKIELGKKFPQAQ
ncbi:MAG: glycosyltransferase, partial [Bacteroidetes bacterium]